MVFSAVGIDHDDRGAARSGQVDGAVQPNAVGQQVSSQLFGGGVIADGADELHLRARPRRGHGLISRPCRRGRRLNDDASTVSPGRGRAWTSSVRSMFTLPTTQTRAAILPTVVAHALIALTKSAMSSILVPVAWRQMRAILKSRA